MVVAELHRDTIKCWRDGDKKMLEHYNHGETVRPDAPPDVLKGAAEIAAYLFGSAARRREVYHLVEQGALPHFKLGSIICARRSTLTTWISQMEAAQ